MISKMIRLPDFFLVGASKAGTTAICETLANHPHICFSEQKEPDFFSEFDISLNAIPHEKLLEYQQLFCVNESHQLLGEGSVRYLNSPQATYWINRYVPSAKIIIILRNPMQRIISLYEMYSRMGIMQMTPDQAFTVESYVAKQCLLYKHIIRYIDTFSKEQVLIMTFDDFLKDQAQAFLRLCQFIGVQKTSNMTMPERNKGGVPRSKSLSWMSNRKLIRIAKKILPISKRAQVDNFIKKTFFKKISLSSIQQDQLKQFFYGDVEQISNLIERDLCQEWQLDV
ncbi:MAG: sulfotransferase domain-containing protein [Cyanobacteria bacterium P01_G01_bin.54]